MPDKYSFQTLFVEQLNDLLSAEEQIAKFLPHVVDVTSCSELREAFECYLQETFHHLDYIKKIFTNLNINGNKVKCKAIEGMIEEGKDVMHHGGNSPVKDAALIAIVQRLQHYKIAVYGTARTFARHLNSSKVVDLHNLQRALNEEGEADKKLTRLAEGGMFTTGINEEAVKVTMKAVT
jgi:ferritin-like metal-binding protein YciE